MSLRGTVQLTARRWVPWALTALVALLPLRSAAAQFTVTRLEEHLRLGRDSLVQLIAVKSESNQPQQLRVELNDWERDSLGQNSYLPVGALPSSCGERLQVFPLALQLPPQGTEYLRVAYTPSGAADPGCWSIVLLEALQPPSAAAQSAGASVSVRILTGVKFYIHPETETQDGEVAYADVETRYEVDAATGDSTLVREAVVRFVNTGSAHLVMRTSLELRDERAQLLETLSGPAVYLTPRAFRDVIVRLPALAPGRYLGVMLLDYGGPDIKAAQLEIEVP